MTLEELIAERSRIDKEIEKFKNFNFDVGNIRMIHTEHLETNYANYSIRIRFDAPYLDGTRSTYKEVLRYRGQIHPNGTKVPCADIESVVAYFDNGLDVLIKDLQDFKEEFHKRLELRQDQ